MPASGSWIKVYLHSSCGCTRYSRGKTNVSPHHGPLQVWEQLEPVHVPQAEPHEPEPEPGVVPQAEPHGLGPELGVPPEAEPHEPEPVSEPEAGPHGQGPDVPPEVGLHG